MIALGAELDAAQQPEGGIGVHIPVELNLVQILDADPAENRSATHINIETLYVNAGVNWAQDPSTPEMIWHSSRIERTNCR